MKLTNKEILKQIFNFTEPFRWTLLVVFLLICSITLIEALNTYFLSKVFDVAQVGGDVYQAILWTSLAAFFVLGKIVLIRIRERIEINKLDVYVDNYLNYESIQKFFSFSNGQHINEHSGVKQNIVQSGFGSIHSQINMFIYNFVPQISQYLISIVILFTVHPLMGLAYLIASCFFLYSFVKFNEYLNPKIRTVRDIRNQNSRFISEIYRYVFLIKNEVAENKSLTNLGKVQQNFQNEYSNTWLSAVDKLTIIRFSSQAFRWISIFVSVLLVVTGHITSGSLFLMFVWSGNFINSLWGLTDMQKQFITDKMNIEKYFELLHIQPDVVIKNDAQSIEQVNEIVFENIHFSYPKRVKDFKENESEASEYILKGVGFRIIKGEKVAFVGESGSGKSTLTNLLRRSFDPQIGTIEINGINLKDIDLKSLLNRIGSVDQEVILFDTSLRENISFGMDRLLTDDELDEVAKLSGIWKFKHKLEWGWDTIIGERGCKLSGGEKQRVGIARALAKNPELLIFDEATSALDSVSELEVQEAIEQSCKGKTSIIIAHRLSTVRDCDKIFVMKGGVILDYGTHEELLQKCEYYKTLIKNQISSYDIVE